MKSENYINVSLELDKYGLVWHPEIGDEISLRGQETHVSILVDPQGLTPRELRDSFVWLPNVEQLVTQIEARQGLIFHAGITETLEYEAIVKVHAGLIAAKANSLRVAFGKALSSLLESKVSAPLH